MSDFDVLIDITRLADRMLQGRLPTGVDRVSLAYIDHFRADSAALIRFGGRWIEFSSADSQRLFDALLGRYEAASAILRLCVGRAYAISWKRAQANYLFNTGHSGLDQPSYPGRVRKRGLRPIYCLYDLIPITHPEYCRSGEAERHKRRLDAMLSTGSGLIVNSRAVLEDIKRYAMLQGVRLPPCVVAPLAPAQLPVPLSRRPIDEPYFVVLSTIEPRKNHLMLLQMWRSLVCEFGDKAPKLVVIGQRGWECEQVVDLLERCDVLKGHVIEKAECNDRELATWLAHSRALLFPTFVEGFGMPLIEALVMGVPVIASRLAVFQEFAGDIPDYLDPIDALGWRRAILDYAAWDSELRAAQESRMRGYAPPTWRQHFDTVEGLIERIPPCC